MILCISKAQIVGNKKCLMNFVFSHTFFPGVTFLSNQEGSHIWTFSKYYVLAILNLSVMRYLNTLN
jgi:hypothetical protein